MGLRLISGPQPDATFLLIYRIYKSTITIRALIVTVLYNNSCYRQLSDIRRCQKQHPPLTGAFFPLFPKQFHPLFWKLLKLAQHHFLTLNKLWTIHVSFQHYVESFEISSGWMQLAIYGDVSMVVVRAGSGASGRSANGPPTDFPTCGCQTGKFHRGRTVAPSSESHWRGFTLSFSIFILICCS